MTSGLVLVHHGLFWGFQPVGLTPVPARLGEWLEERFALEAVFVDIPNPV